MFGCFSGRRFAAWEWWVSLRWLCWATWMPQTTDITGGPPGCREQWIDSLNIFETGKLVSTCQREFCVDIVTWHRPPDAWRFHVSCILLWMVPSPHAAKECLCGCTCTQHPREVLQRLLTAASKIIMEHSNRYYSNILKHFLIACHLRVICLSPPVISISRHPMMSRDVVKRVGGGWTRFASEAIQVSMLGRVCGMKTRNIIVAPHMDAVVPTRLPLKSTRCINPCQCHRHHGCTTFQYHLHHTSCTRQGCTTWSQRSSTRKMFSLTTVMKAIPIGTLAGLITRSLGAAATTIWDALAPGMEATMFTLMSLNKEWDMRMDESTIVMPASPIGCKVGQIPRRTGAALNKTRAAQSSTAILVRSFDCTGPFGPPRLKRGAFDYQITYWEQTIDKHQFHMTYNTFSNTF